MTTSIFVFRSHQDSISWVMQIDKIKPAAKLIKDQAGSRNLLRIIFADEIYRLNIKRKPTIEKG